MGFPRAQPATAIRIHENNAPGALIEVIALGTGGRSRVVWRGDDPTRAPGVFTVPADTDFDVKRVRVVLDTRRVGGWNEIDAVQLVGTSGSQWAVSARASSYFGQGRRRR